MNSSTEPGRPLQILIIEDRAADAELLLTELRRAGVRADGKRVATKEAYLESLEPSLDAIISEYDLPQFGAREALELLQARGLDIPFIIVSGAIGEESAVELMKLGAADYLPKGRRAQMPETLARAIGATARRRERKVYETALRDSEERLRTIIDNEPECVKTVSADGHLLEMNPAGLKMIEAESSAQVSGRLVSELIHPLDRVRFEELHRKAADGGSGQLQFRIIGLKQTERWMETHSVGLRNGEAGPSPVLSVTRDITKQRRAEEALRAQEEQYRLLFQNNPSPMWVYDIETLAFLEINDMAVQQYGYSREEFLAMTIDEIRPVEDIPRHREALANMVDTSVYGNVWQHCRRDGTVRLVETYSTTIVFHGKAARMVVCIDVTERHKAVETLRRSEENLALAQRVTHTGSWEMSLEGGLPKAELELHWSDENFRIFGYEPGSVDATQGFFVERVYPEDREMVSAAFVKAAKTGTPYSVEHRIILPDGTEREVHEQAHFVRGEPNGEMIKVIGTTQDVTERKKAERLLREQAEMLNLAHDAIIVRRHDNGRIIFWNKGAERLYGWTASEAIGRPISKLIFDDPEHDRATSQFLDAHGDFLGEVRQVTKDGRALVVNARSNVIRQSDGTPRAVLVINTDITEHKKLQTQFLRAQRLESIGTLASGVAHDLNNILSPILMAAPLLHDELDAETRARVISTIEQSAERGAQIVKQVLTFARGVEGERILIDLTHLVKEMAQIAEQTFPKSIRVTARYPDDLWLVEGDPTQLHQILLNLSVNARDAMPTGGALLLAAENFEVDQPYAFMMPEAKPGPYVLLTATDTGIGMSREIIDKIFDPFFTTKEIGGGTGLGLSTVLGIARSHGGFVAVESERGKGATFKIFLPASNGVAAVQEPVKALPKGNGETILIVDDEPAILSMTKLILENHHYHVLTASDGPEALVAFAHQMEAIDLVVTDLMMPFMDGVAVVRSLRKMKPGIRIIASTGQSEQARLPELEALGVAASLSKPYNGARLLKTLHDVLTIGRENGETIS